MIAACEQWREPLGVAPWELQLGPAVGGNVRVDAGGVPSLSESVNAVVDDVSELISFEIKDPLQAHQGRIGWHFVTVNRIPSVEGLD